MPVVSLKTNGNPSPELPCGFPGRGVHGRARCWFPGDLNGAVGAQGDVVVRIGDVLGEQPPVGAVGGDQLKGPFRNERTLGGEVLPRSFPISWTWPIG
jgi:hypothetical protein